MTIDDIENTDIDYKDFLLQFPNKRFYHISIDGLKSNKVNKFKFRNKSTNTFILIHNKINELSKQKFGLPIRNLLFCRGVEFVGDSNEFEVYPLGDQFRIFANPKINDLAMAKNTTRVNVVDALVHEAAKISKYQKELIKLFKQKLLVQAINTKSERSFWKDTKDLIDEFFVDEIRTQILEGMYKVYNDKVINLAKEYVRSTIEIHNEDEITNDMIDSEYMLYCPDDFYMK